MMQTNHIGGGGRPHPIKQHQPNKSYIQTMGNMRRQYLIHKRISADTFTKKKTYNSIIPLNIFQTWDNKHNLPSGMRKAMNRIKALNPEFRHQIFTDTECHAFIKANFEPGVANAYKRLVPNAYRADLWRYCVLYIKGGIYMDVKYVPNTNFSFMELTEAEHFSMDANQRGIYNAFMVALPKNPDLLLAINKIVENVKQRNYGIGFLDVTGPTMLSKIIKIGSKTVDMTHKYYDENFQNRVVMYKGKHILRCYPNYQAEQVRTGGKHYAELWQRRNVFR